MKTTRVQCTQCGYLIDSTTVTKKSYKLGEIIDHGCPWCGPETPLSSISAKRKVKKKDVDEPIV